MAVLTGPCSKICRRIRGEQVIVPLTASVHGAMGLIGSDVVYEYGKSDHLLVPADIGRINTNFSFLVAKAIADLRSAGFEDQAIMVTRSLDVRYRYQVHELNVPLASGMLPISADEMEQAYSRFDELYEQTYGAGSESRRRKRNYGLPGDCRRRDREAEH